MKSIHDAAYRRFLGKLKEAREAARLNQEELATRLGHHQTFVSKVENGQRSLDVLEFLTWAREVGVPPMDLLHELVLEIDSRRPARQRVRLPRKRIRLEE